MDTNGPIWYPYTQMQTAPEPLHITKGEGIWLYDINDKKYIDAISSWWVNIHGHSNPFIQNAIHQQAGKLEQVIFAGCTHEPAIHLANKLLEKCNVPNGKVFYSDNGSTAVEVGVKMALQYFYNLNRPRTKIVTWENDFHGETFGAMSVSDHGQLNAPFEKLLFHTIKIPIPKSIEDDETFSLIEKIFNNKDIAAFVFEPLIQGTAGMLTYDPSILDKTMSIARKNGSLNIADEVLTGTYRTGTYLATSQCSIQPDIICMAKGLTGGFLPLAVTIAQQYIFDAFLSNEKNFALFHGHSYTANPLGCAAAIASITLTETSSFIENLKVITSFVNDQKLYYQDKYPVLKPRSCGSIFAITLPSERNGYFSEIFSKIHAHFLGKNIFLRPLGNVLYVLPPLCITLYDLRYIFECIEEYIQQHVNAS